MRRLILAPIVAIALLGCKEAEPEKLLSASQISDRNELIGGPLAHGEVGDYLIENDQVRFVISGPHHSWGPGLFGGTVVDADLRRPHGNFRRAEGNDQFAELFPTANIVVADPTANEIEVVNDGSDGTAAIVKASGRGVMFLEALEILDPRTPSSFKDVIALLDIQTIFDFETTYTLRPGDRFLEITTTIARPEDLFQEDEEGCDEECEYGRLRGPDGKLTCTCDPGRRLDYFTESVPLLARVLGSGLAPGPGDPVKAGLIGGDFLFFGGGTNVFAPGLGFDEKGAIFANLFRGVDTITSPLTFDWLGSVGKDVSYGIFTKRETKPDTCEHRIVLTRLTDPDGRDQLETDFDAGQVLNLVEQRIPLPVLKGVAEGDVEAKLAEVEAQYGAIADVGSELDGDCRPPKLLIPLFTSSATLVSGSGLACLDAPDDDDTCDQHRVYRHTRYLVVGEGDVATVAKTVFEQKEIATGKVTGSVLDARFGRALPRSEVFALRDPDKTKTFATYEAVTAANLEDTTRLGVLNHARADVGASSERNGRYEMHLPAGSWLLVGRAGGVMGTPVRIEVTAGGADVINIVVDPPAHLQYRVLDETGAIMPAKLTLVALDDDGEPMYADGKRRVELGDGRLDDGIYRVIYSGEGHGAHDVEAGRYRITASRGFEYSIDVQDIELRAGSVTTLSAQLTREVDTTGYISGDFHLHAEPSMDSGMDMALRVVTNIVEGVELLSSSDHDNVADYGPTLRELGLDSFATTQVGTELTTLELGHFLGFPLKYDHTNEPVHGAVDWVCQHPQEMFDDLRALGEFGPEETVNVVAHPRDGFFGYWDQLAIDPWTGERGDLGLSSNNPLLRVASCDFDAFELLNAKRFELVRTPTVAEINDAERCLQEINAATSNADVRNACEWLRQPETCKTQDRLRGEPCAWYAAAHDGFQACTDDDSSTVCRDRARNAVTLLSVRRMLYRTPEEQAAWTNATEDQRNPDETECNPAKAAKAPVGDALEAERAAAPCAQHEGVADDWFTLLNWGLNVTAMGNSDSHGTSLEPGMPRNWVASSTDDAGRIDRREIAANIKAQKVLASTGPFVEVSIDGKGMGETVKSSGKVALKVKVQTPSWFSVSRLEVYRNGDLAHAEDIDSDAAAIVDFDDTIELDADVDSWFVVSVFGLDDEDFLGPVYHTIPLGELSFSKITALAFGNLGIIGAALGQSAQIPDYFPSLPYAMTNPIFVDVDGQGYTPPKGTSPPFCPKACDGDDACPKEGEVCHDNADVGIPGDGGTCGPEIFGNCGLNDVLVEPKEEGALTVAPAEGHDPLARLRDRQQPDFHQRELRRAIRNHLLNGFAHPIHAHREAEH